MSSPNEPTENADDTSRSRNERDPADDGESVRNSAPAAGKTDRGAPSPDPETDRDRDPDGPLGDDAGRGASGGVGDDGSAGAGDRTAPTTRKWLSAAVALVGLWIGASPFLYGDTTVARWNNLAVGGAIALLGAYNFYRASEGQFLHEGVAGLAALLGVWSIVAPAMLGFESRGLFWSTAVSGLVVAALSAYNAYESRNTGATARSGTRA